MTLDETEPKSEHLGARRRPAHERDERVDQRVAVVLVVRDRRALVRADRAAEARDARERERLVVPDLTEATVTAPVRGRREREPADALGPCAI